MAERSYIAIDLKSFYASVECILRERDPMTTNLVVADESRTEKTICLAVSPSLKSFGIPGRPRLFEVVQRVAEVNALRRSQAPDRKFTGTSDDLYDLRRNPALELTYIVAPPQMAMYMETSAAIYNIYLKYIAPEDIHVYSIDEVFIDATAYLKMYGCDARELARRMILDVLNTTGITATAGIGTNLYLCKVAMDIMAKRIPADASGLRIAELTELSYRQQLWSHRPLTDFWRVGRGIARKLEQHGLFTMGDVARCSMDNEDLLYKLFGVYAELLIDHAWGWESATIAHIRAYRPQSNSLSSGQVLHCPYDNKKARLVLREMADLLALDLVEKGLQTDQLVVTVGYDIENLTDPARRKAYQGEVVRDHYGRELPKHAHGTVNLDRHTASTKVILGAVMDLYDRITDPELLIRRLNVAACRVLPEHIARQNAPLEQMNLFDMAEQPPPGEDPEREHRRQQAILAIKRRYGKNAILKGMNLEEGATARDRHSQIGGHKA